MSPWVVPAKGLPPTATAVKELGDRYLAIGRVKDAELIEPDEEIEVPRALLEQVERMRQTIWAGPPVEAEAVTPRRELLLVGVDVFPTVDINSRHRVNDCG